MNEAKVNVREIISMQSELENAIGKYKTLEKLPELQDTIKRVITLLKRIEVEKETQ